MNPDSYRFTVGKFNCIVVNDGALTYSNPAQLHFANAPLDRLTQVLHQHSIQLDQWDEWISPLPCLVIQTNEHQILVDTGLGNVDFAPNAGRLLQNLQTEGVNPGDIDAVILTHAHGDHIGGNADSNGRAAFPQARYIMRKEEWDFWTSKTTLSQPEHEWMTSFVDKQLLPLRSCFELLERDTEITPGIRTLFAPGHTPGHMALIVESDGEQLLCFGDAVGHPIHTEEPDWYIAPDCQPKQAIHTRRQLLERATVKQTRIFAFHFDFPGLGHVRQQQDVWKWFPIDDAPLSCGVTGG